MRDRRAKKRFHSRRYAAAKLLDSARLTKNPATSLRRSAGGDAISKQILAALVLCLLFALAGHCFAQTASTPAGSEKLSVTSPPVDPTSLENRFIRATGPGTAGQTDNTTGNSAPGFNAAQVVGALALVVALIFGLRFVARRYFAMPTVRTSPLVKVLARSPVSPKQQVLLLHVGRRILVVADSGGAMQPLAQITDADEVAALLGQLNSNANLARSPFAPLFSRLRRDFDPDEMPEAIQEPESPPAELVDNEEVSETTQELQGLMEKVRLVSRRLGKTG